MNWKLVGVIFGAFPLIFGAILGWIVFPINVDGYWEASDPSKNRGTAFQGCIHLKQAWPRTSVLGSITRKLDDRPNIVGVITDDRLSFEYLVFDRENKPGYGTGTLSLNPQGELSGIWRETEKSGKFKNKGRWKLSARAKDCKGKAIPSGERPPKGFFQSIWCGLTC